MEGHFRHLRTHTRAQQWTFEPAHKKAARRLQGRKHMPGGPVIAPRAASERGQGICETLRAFHLMACTDLMGEGARASET